jgi:hypothetical protein
MRVNSIIPGSTATTSTVPTITSTADTWTYPEPPELPDARDLFELRVRGTKTLVIIPRNSMAQALLWDLMNTPALGYAVRGNQGFKDDHTLRVTEATIDFKPWPKTDLPKEATRSKGATRSRPRRHRS